MKRHEFFIDLLVLMILLSSSCSTPPEIEPQPTQTADPNSLIHTLPLANYPPSSTPYHIEGGDFWLAHIPGGKLFSFAPVSPEYANHVSVDECRFTWSEAVQRFVDPCSGNEWDLDGRLNLNHSPEMWSTSDLDQYATTFEDGLIYIYLDQIVPGISRNETAVQGTAIPTTELPPTPAYVPTFETAECQFVYTVEADIQCGYLTVPEDRARPERMIRLHVAVIAGRSSNPAPDPVVYLNGGPGAHTLVATDYYATQFEDILDQRDLILFDQRGVGYSEPSLDCPEIMADILAHLEADLDPVAERTNYLAALAECRARLTADGVNLSAYNSTTSAADLDDLRQALGYETWNLLGVSYGTRLALTAMRDFGSTGTIRSVILDSVFPPQVDARAVASADIDRAFNLMFTRCAANEACNKAYPDLKTRFYQLVDDLNHEPINVLVTDRETRTTYRVPFNGYDLIDTLYKMMYSAGQIITLPRLLTRLERNSTSAISDWLTDWLRQPNYTSLGMTYSTQCAEEFPFNDLAQFEASLEGLPPQLADFIQIEGDDVAAICALWPVEAANPLETEPVSSDIPTLLLSGDYDPVTPPSFAQDTAVYLGRAYTFEFEGQSHGIVASNECGLEMVLAFLNQPDMSLDDSCLDDLYFGFVTDR